MGAGGIGFAGSVSADLISVDGPHGATNVQQALDLSRVFFGGNFGIVDTLDDLDTFAPPDDMTGERIIAGSFWVSDQIVLRDDEWCSIGQQGVLVGPSSDSCGLNGKVAGALIRGPVVAQQMGFSNNSLDPAAALFDITSAAGRAPRLEHCTSRGQAPLGTISGVLNLVNIERFLSQNSKSGFEVTGTVVGVEFLNCVFQVAPGLKAITVDGAANILLALSFNGCSFLTTTAADRGISISDSATIPGGTIPSSTVGVSIIACKTTGPGQLLDQSVGTLPHDSHKIITEGNPDLNDSRYLGDASFEDYGTTIVVTYSGAAPTAWQVVPSENGDVSTVLTELDAAARFTLVRSGIDPTDWYIRADGPAAQNTSLLWDVSLEANAGGGAGEFIEFRVTKQSLGVGSWDLVDGSAQRLEQRTTSRNNNHASFDIANQSDRYRLEMRNLTATSSTKLQHFNIILAKA